MQQLPKEIIGCISPLLDRKSIGALCCTNKYINKFLKSKNELFYQWPALGGCGNPTDSTEMVHLIRSPDGTKLCIVTRRYRQPGRMRVYDVRTGPICVVDVNNNFEPVFSPSSDIIIAGSVSENERGVLLGRISSTGNTRANKERMRYVIHWHNCFNEYAITGATFIDKHQVWISHTSGGERPQLSCRHVYSFTIHANSLQKWTITVSNLQQCPFTIPISETFHLDDEVSVDVMHHYPHTAVAIHGPPHYPHTEVNVRRSHTKQVVFYKHTPTGYHRTIIPMNPRLHVQSGLMVSFTFSPQSTSFIGVANGIANGRIVTYFDETVGHFLNNGPFQNLSLDLNYFGAYGPPKIWYYDGDLLVYSIHELPNCRINNRSTEEERELFRWKAAQLSPPKAIRVRGKVSDDIKECIMEDEQRQGYVTYERYYEKCILEQPFVEGWCPVMWDLILNNRPYD